MRTGEAANVWEEGIKLHRCVSPFSQVIILVEVVIKVMLDAVRGHPYMTSRDVLDFFTPPSLSVQKMILFFRNVAAFLDPLPLASRTLYMKAP